MSYKNLRATAKSNEILFCFPKQGQFRLEIDILYGSCCFTAFRSFFNFCDLKLTELSIRTHDLFVGFVSMDHLHIALDFFITFSCTYIMYFDLRKEIRPQSKSFSILGRQTLRYQQDFGFKGNLNLYYI